MTDFAFPDISGAEAPAQVPAVKPTAALDLEKLDLTALAIHKFGDWRNDVAEVRKTLDGAVHDLSTQAKVDEAKSLRFRLIGQPRADVRKVSKGLKSKLAAVSKAVGAEEEAAVAAYDDAEKLITPQIDAREAELEAARLERERIAAERAAKQAEGIARIRGYLTRAQTEPGMTADRVALGIAGLVSMEFTAADWLDPVAAADAQCQTVEAMRQLHGTLLAREAEDARLEAQRVENERVAREQAEQRAELDRQAEALKAQQQRIADIQARIAEIRAAATGHETSSAADLYEVCFAVAALDVSEAQYGEFAALAAAERATTHKVLEKLHADAVKREEVERVLAMPLELTLPADEPAVEVAQERGFCAGTPATYASNAADSATAAPSGAEGEGAHADVSAPIPAKTVITVELDDSPAFVPEVLPKPTLMLGTINERIAPLSITGAGLSLLGFEPAGRRKSAVLFNESDWPAMLAAMVKSLEQAA